MITTHPSQLSITAMATLKRPIFKAPTQPPDWAGPEGLTELKKHLQTAVLIELHTIPLYLFAAYSIDDNPLSTYKIIGEFHVPAWAIERGRELTNG